MSYIIVSSISEFDVINKYIGTHNGSYQADEVLAVVLLKILPQFQNHIILRSRKQDQLNRCQILVDVGMEYNIETMRFDHHQQEFNETFNNNFQTKLSSAGLIYKNFGMSILKEIVNEYNYRINNKLTSLTLTKLNLLYNKVYRNFIESIDAIDNGIPICNGKQNYIILTSLSSRISHMNPTWNEESSDKIINDRFKEALIITEKEFKDHVIYLYSSWLPAYDIVKDAISHRHEIHYSGRIIVLKEYCPWQAHLSNIEYEFKIKDHINYIISKYNNVYTIAVVKDIFPKSWHGLENIELSNKTNVFGCIFIHNSGTTASNKTLEGAIRMCILSLEQKN